MSKEGPTLDDGIFCYRCPTEIWDMESNKHEEMKPHLRLDYTRPAVSVPGSNFCHE